MHFRTYTYMVFVPVFFDGTEVVIIWSLGVSKRRIKVGNHAHTAVCTEQKISTGKTGGGWAFVCSYIPVVDHVCTVLQICAPYLSGMYTSGETMNIRRRRRRRMRRRRRRRAGARERAGTRTRARVGAQARSTSTQHYIVLMRCASGEAASRGRRMARSTSKSKTTSKRRSTSTSTPYSRGTRAVKQ